jgi:deoxyribonuclease-4
MQYIHEHLIGAHLSVAGGYEHAIYDGTTLGCTAIQIFTKSNRQWYAKPITEKNAITFIQAQKASGINLVLAHASYLINLGSENSLIIEKSLQALIDEINRCHQLEIPYLVLHPGTGRSLERLQSIGQAIEQALQLTQQTNVTVLLETMAGQGSSAGSTFQELANILEYITLQQRVGVCLDTCHIFAAGYDFTTEQGYVQTFQIFDTIIGLSRLKAFHINDSKKEYNCHVDRHENIGEGKIPLSAFARLLQDERFTHLPKILETPKLDGLENDKKNIDTLIKLLTADINNL